MSAGTLCSLPGLTSNQRKGGHPSSSSLVAAFSFYLYWGLQFPTLPPRRILYNIIILYNITPFVMFTEQIMQLMKWDSSVRTEAGLLFLLGRTYCWSLQLNVFCNIHLGIKCFPFPFLSFPYIPYLLSFFILSSPLLSPLCSSLFPLFFFSPRIYSPTFSIPFLYVLFCLSSPNTTRG